MELIGCWEESGLGEKMVASRSARDTKNTLELLQPVSLSPQRATAVPAPHHHLGRNPPIPAGRSDPGPGAYAATASPLVPGVYETLCVPFKSGVSLFLTPAIKSH